jgi:hypothetical protein
VYLRNGGAAYIAYTLAPTEICASPGIGGRGAVLMVTPRNRLLALDKVPNPLGRFDALSQWRNQGHANASGAGVETVDFTGQV